MAKPARRGLMLMEVVVSMAMLGVVLATVAQVIQWSAVEHRTAQRKRCALETARSLLDELSAKDWSAINSENASRLRIPRESAQFLIDPRLKMAVATQSGLLPSKRISVELTWSNGPGRASEQVQLSTWVFQPSPAKYEK